MDFRESLPRSGGLPPLSCREPVSPLRPASRLRSSDVAVETVGDGDHRLSQDADLARLARRLHGVLGVRGVREVHGVHDA